jgi:hypothetical protein
MHKCYVNVLCWSIFVPAACSNPTDENYFKPPRPGSYVLVETANMDLPGYIMLDVQKMLLQKPVFSKKMYSHGANTPTSYGFKFKGRCDQEKALVAAVRVEIRKTTNALIVCTDTPPDVEYGVPPNLPGK